MTAFRPSFAAALMAMSWTAAAADAPAHEASRFWAPPASSIEKYLGKPYAWGSSGLKNFDCSGFVWRVMLENGILVKRTTARKFYMMLPPVPRESRYQYGNIMFFDNLKHCGIIATERSFYHAQVSMGTNLSPFTPLWRNKVCGFRGVRAPAEPAVADDLTPASAPSSPAHSW